MSVIVVCGLQVSRMGWVPTKVQYEEDDANAQVRQQACQANNTACTFWSATVAEATSICASLVSWEVLQSTVGCSRLPLGRTRDHSASYPGLCWLPAGTRVGLQALLQDDGGVRAHVREPGAWIGLATGVTGAASCSKWGMRHFARRYGTVLGNLCALLCRSCNFLWVVPGICSGLRLAILWATVHEQQLCMLAHCCAMGQCSSLPAAGDLTVDYSDDEESPDATPITLPEPYDLVLQDIAVQTGVNRLHSLLLGSKSELMVSHLAAEGLIDLQLGPWQLAAPGGEYLRSRQVSYIKKLNIPVPLAPKQCQVGTAIALSRPDTHCLDVCTRLPSALLLRQTCLHARVPSLSGFDMVIGR